MLSNSAVLMLAAIAVPALAWSLPASAERAARPSGDVAASLEPDSVGSHVGVGLIEVGADGIAPVYRVPVGAKRPRLGRSA